MLSFAQAESEWQINQVRGLWREYERWLGLDLCFQNFEQELATLPGKYAPPDGRLYLAADGERVAGSVAFRKIGDGVCEMKRLYVRPEFRGRGLGRQLTLMLIEEARGAGYARMRLDTLPAKMGRAVEVYRSLGFREVEPYYNSGNNELIFMELKYSDRFRVSYD